MSSRALVVSVFSVLALAACDERSATPPPQPSAPAPTPSAPAAAVPTPTAPPTSDLSRDLGGVLPLKHGIFVSADVSCADPPNAALRRYDGQGLSGAHTHACQIKVVGQRGAAYDIEQSCIDAGQGPAPRSTEKATIEIQDNLTFTLKRGGAGDNFRYCAASMLPPSLRQW